VSIGDGATSEGEFWESLNTACTRACRSSTSSRTTATPSRCRSRCRPPAATSRAGRVVPGLKVIRCDGTDFLASYRADGEAVAYARASAGRLRARQGHPPLLALALRRRAALQDRRRSARPRPPRSDHPHARVPAWRGLATEADLEAIAADVDREVQPRPPTRRSRRRSPPSRHRRLYVYSPTSTRRGRLRHAEPAPEGKPDTMVAAINRTLQDEMARNPRIVVFGEDVADASREAALATCGQGRRVQGDARPAAAFGGERVFNSPLAEANIIGRAVGMATAASSRWSRSSSSTTSGRR
jgi:2-oxoisovalerate dehydrogenase E1 component